MVAHNCKKNRNVCSYRCTKFESLLDPHSGWPVRYINVRRFGGLSKFSFPLLRTQTRIKCSLSGGWICQEFVSKMYIENGQEQVKTLIRSC